MTFVRRTLERSPVGPAVLLFAVLAACYLASTGLRASRGAAITGDEPFYLVTTQSLLQDGDLDLRQQYASASYRSFFDHPEPLWRQADPLPDGRLLSPHQPGLAVLLIPGFALGGLLGAQLQLLLISAAAFALAYHVAARELGHRWLTWGATGMVALSPPAFVYATELYPEMPAALCLVATVFALRAWAGVRRGLAIVGLSTALAWLGLKYVPLVLVIAAFGLWRASMQERTWIVGLGTLSAAAYIGWHLATFGALTPYQTNLAYAGAPVEAVIGAHLGFEDRVYRLWGLFIDRRFGIGRWAPILLLVLPALPIVWRRMRDGRLVVSAVVAQILVATFLSVTMMGWWFPGRMLIVVLPLLAIIVAAAIVRLPGPGRLMALIAGGYSLLITVLLVDAAWRGEVVLAVDPFRMAAWPFQELARVFPLYTWWSEETIALNAAWLVGLGVATLFVARIADGRTARQHLPSGGLWRPSLALPARR
jgi:hypothetical protein